MYAYTLRVGASLDEISSSLPDDGGLFWSGVASSVWWAHLGSRAWTRRCGVGARRGNSADYPLIRNRIALQWIYPPSRCNLVYFSEGSFHCYASRSCITHVCHVQWHYCHASGALTLNTKLQTLVVLSRWSWAREGTSFQTVWPRRTKRGERLTRGNTWLSAGDVKKLNRCVFRNVSGFRADVIPQLHKHASESSAVKPWTSVAPCCPPHLLSMQMHLYFRWIRRFLVGCIKSKELPVVWRRSDGAVSSSASRPLSSHLSGAVCERSVHLPGFSWRL